MDPLKSIKTPSQVMKEIGEEVFKHFGEAYKKLDEKIGSKMEAALSEDAARERHLGEFIKHLTETTMTEAVPSPCDNCVKEDVCPFKEEFLLIYRNFKNAQFAIRPIGGDDILFLDRQDFLDLNIRCKKFYASRPAAKAVEEEPPLTLPTFMRNRKKEQSHD